MGRPYDLLQSLPRLRMQQEGIAKHIGLILIIGALLVIVGLTGILLHTEQRRHTQHLLAHGTTLTTLISQAAADSMAAGRIDELQKLVQALRDRSVAYGFIVDTHNRILAHTDARQRGRQFEPQSASNVQTALGLRTTVYQDATRGQTIRQFSMPIDTDVRHIGTVYIGMFTRNLGAAFWQLIENVSLMALIIFLLVPVVYYLLRALMRPMQQLNARLEALGSWEQLHPIESAHRGEVGELVQHWNQIIINFKEAFDAIKESNFELEITANVISYEKRQLEMILDRLSDAILITNSLGKVIFANKMITRILNLELDKILEKNLQECFTNEDIRNFLADNEEIGHNVTLRSIEISLDGYELETFQLTFSSIIDNEEKFIGYFIIIRNITQQKVSEQARSEFISAVSHELKNPLTTIKSYIELLTNQFIDDNKTKYDFYNTINNEADRMAKLIDNLLNLSKIELGSLQIKPNRVRMKQLLMDSFQAMESQARAKGITFDLHLPEKLSTPEVDKDLLSVVIMNLLSNALKYTPEGGEVTLLAEETEEEMLIHVRDTGIGIADAELPHIFERFYRGHNGEHTAGSGLGLALVQQIMHLHGGAINVTSQPHQGSHFTVVLPRNRHASTTIGIGSYSREDSDH